MRKNLSGKDLRGIILRRVELGASNLRGADLSGAIIIQSNFTGKKIVWGSSYSASLAIQLAANYGKDISGVLAFSPASGRSMASCLPNEYFDQLASPLLLLRPSSELQNEQVKAQLELAAENGHQTYVAEHGVHGSSMLVEERVGTGVEENWLVVSRFLETVRE